VRKVGPNKMEALVLVGCASTNYYAHFSKLLFKTRFKWLQNVFTRTKAVCFPLHQSLGWKIQVLIWK